MAYHTSNLKYLLFALLVSGFTNKISHEPLRLPGMVWIPGGSFVMGGQDKAADALPPHRVTVDGFWMDATEVTNKQFEQFVRETGYVTVAERTPGGAGPVSAGSLVFTPPAHPVNLAHYYSWWSFVPGASWRCPTGPQSSIADRRKHPVVHVAWQDAQAYARWAGKRLPTEAEFEYASRGGLDRAVHSWGNELTPHGVHQANLWQGAFPHANSLEDGFHATVPVRSFAPNAYGLYDMTGNVWEWCSDWYHANHYRERVAENNTVCNPQGPGRSFDPVERRVPKKVLRGGSYLCTSTYCTRYRVGARGKAEPDSSACHTGFRCVKSKEMS